MTQSVYQFKVSLTDIEPAIWRRILVPENYTFWDLHVAIQDSLGWLDYHLHVFRIKKKDAHKILEIGIPDDERDESDPERIPDWEVLVSSCFSEVGMTCEYEYDFGDGWRHDIQFEGIVQKERGQKYPKCIDGQRSCPPEDVGGVTGYYHLLEVLNNPKDKEYKEMIEWLGRKYDPNEFATSIVKFDDPRKRWRTAFTERPRI